MNSEREVKRLQSILRTRRLSFSERLAIEMKIRDLESPDLEAVRLSMPGVFGVFDRPAPGTSTSDAEPSKSDSTAGKSPPETGLVPSTPEVPEPDHSPGELDALAERIVNLADHIVRVRRVWATTLSVELDREAELWLAKLHEVARDLPGEIVELILHDRANLMHQKPRDVSKPAISQEIQQRLIAPSAPSIDVTGTSSEIYFGIHESRRPAPPQHPPGYVPDGLQQFL